MSECREKCKQELEELRKHQTERMQLLLQQHEEKEQQLKRENEEREQQLQTENKEKEQRLKEENGRVLALLIQEKEEQEVLMLAKHESEEEAARKAEELQADRNASAANQPQVPECPVGDNTHILAFVCPPKYFNSRFAAMRWFPQSRLPSARMVTLSARDASKCLV